jgi:hypothetical protein
MPVEMKPDFTGWDLSMTMALAPISLAFALSGSTASARVRTWYLFAGVVVGDDPHDVVRFFDQIVGGVDDNFRVRG